jgi:hypothetical protein
MVIKHSHQDPYWYQVCFSCFQSLTRWKVGLVLQQLRGLYDGYTAYSTTSEKVDRFTVLLYQLSYELGDIQEGVVTDPEDVSPFLVQKRMLDSHCSVLVRYTSRFVDLPCNSSPSPFIPSFIPNSVLTLIRVSDDGQHLYSSHGTVFMEVRLLLITASDLGSL